jgi:anionic cell wall polymer biosynthesis LytR-Cps2A-Psr (LCP) family protein
LDGKTALKYVRSRHSEGNTGSDFARAARQQQVIEAVSKKALSWEILLNPVKMKEIFDSFVAGVETDLGFWEAERFYNIGKDFNFKNISTIVLDTNNLLTHPAPSEATGFQWVLLPRSGDFSEITLFIQKMFYGVEENK